MDRDARAAGKFLLAVAEHGPEMTHYWRIKKWLPERFREPCRIIATGGLHSCLVEFADGWRVITSLYFIRRIDG